MLLFALDATRAFGARVADALGQPLAPHEERTFEDAEHKIRPRVDPNGQDCVVVQSLHGEPGVSGDDKLVRLLMFIAALRDHGARRVVAVVPYLAYARKDRRTQPFDPVSIRVVAQLFEAVRCDALMTLEAHNVAAFDNAFRLRAVTLSPNALFSAAALKLVGDEPIAVASPDVGGVKRAQLWREALENDAPAAGGAGLRRQAARPGRGQRRRDRHRRRRRRDRADRRRPDRDLRHDRARRRRAAQGRRAPRARLRGARAVRQPRRRRARAHGGRARLRHRHRAPIPPRRSARARARRRLAVRGAVRRRDPARTAGSGLGRSRAPSGDAAPSALRRGSARPAAASAPARRGCGSSRCAAVSRARSSARWTVYSASTAGGGASSSACATCASSRGSIHGAPSSRHSRPRKASSSNGSTSRRLRVELEAVDDDRDPVEGDVLRSQVAVAFAHVAALGAASQRGRVPPAGRVDRVEQRRGVEGRKARQRQHRRGWPPAAPRTAHGSRSPETRTRRASRKKRASRSPRRSMSAGLTRACADRDVEHARGREAAHRDQPVDRLRARLRADRQCPVRRAPPAAGRRRRRPAPAGGSAGPPRRS